MSSDLRVCERCGKEYIPKATNQRFCSRSCRERSGYRRRMNAFAEFGEWRVCEICGERFFTRRPWQRRCAVECGAWKKAKRNVVVVKILITAGIPVFQHLQPQIGSVYDAEKSDARYGPFYIVNIKGSRVIVRDDECVEV